MPRKKAQRIGNSDDVHGRRLVADRPRAPLAAQGDKGDVAVRQTGHDILIRIGVEFAAEHFAIFRRVAGQRQRREGFDQLPPGFCRVCGLLHFLGVGIEIAQALAGDRADEAIAIFREQLLAFLADRLVGRVVHHHRPRTIGMLVEPVGELPSERSHFAALVVGGEDRRAGAVKRRHDSRIGKDGHVVAAGVFLLELLARFGVGDVVGELHPIGFFAQPVFLRFAVHVPEVQKALVAKRAQASKIAAAQRRADCGPAAPIHSALRRDSLPTPTTHDSPAAA